MTSEISLSKENLQHIYQKSLKWSFTGSLVTAIFQLAQMAVFARLAGPEATGVYALAAAFMAFVTPVAEAGLSQAIVQVKTLQRKPLRQLAALNFGFCALIFTGLRLVGPSISQWYHSETLLTVLLLMASSLLFSPIGLQRSALLTRALRFDLIARIESISWAFSFAISITLALYGWGALAMAAGFWIRNLVVMVGSFIAQPALPPDIEAGGSLREYLRFGLFDLSGRWAEYLANYFDKLLLGKWLGMEALGYYNLAFTLLMLPTARIGYVVTRVSFPLYARMRDEQAAVQAFFEKTSRQLILVLFPVYLSLALFAREIALLVFGPEWLPAAPLFVAFGLAGLVRTLCAPFPQLMRGLGKPQLWMVWLLVFTALLNISLYLLLWANPTAGTAGWSRTLVKWLLEIPLLWWLARRVGLSFRPVLQFAGRWLVWLIPVAGATLLVARVPGSFGLVLALKAMVFGLGICWLLFQRLSQEPSQGR